MAYSKIKKICLILLCCIVIIFPFWCVKGLCADSVSGVVLNGIGYNASYETGEIVTLKAIDNAFGIYFPVKAGYSYVLTGNFLDTQYYRMFTTELVPDVGVDAVGMYLGFSPNNYTFTATTDGYLFIWNYSRPMTNDNTNFTTLGGMTDTISSLVDNVGVNQVWEVFEEAIPYIGVVALFVFGFVIITYLYLKISKGKAGF